jgi:hypothetical protein
VTVDVEDDNGTHRAIIPFEGAAFPCCTAGHPDAPSAACHAWKLATAIARKAAGQEGAAGLPATRTS